MKEKKEGYEELIRMTKGKIPLGDLLYFVTQTSLVNEAGKTLMEKYPTKENLLYIIKHTDRQIALTSWGKLLKKFPSNEELKDLTKGDNNIKDEVRKELGQAWRRKIEEIKFNMY